MTLRNEWAWYCIRSAVFLLGNSLGFEYRIGLTWDVIQSVPEILTFDKNKKYAIFNKHTSEKYVFKLKKKKKGYLQSCKSSDLVYTFFIVQFLNGDY